MASSKELREYREALKRGEVVPDPRYNRIPEKPKEIKPVPVPPLPEISPITSDQESDALDREIDLGKKHIELTEIQKGRIPLSVIARDCIAGGIGAGVMLIFMLLKGCL